MAVLKCKMCGGDLKIDDGMTVAECEYCGTKQTVPTADNEKKMTLFARANRLRAACEFDKAAGVYESIVADFPEEAEAYWGLVLCKYGIEYVDDPATGKKIPTCHRSSFDSIMDDDDFEQVMENADAIARRVYREEAKTIENIRKGILEVSSKEEPYDIFICYKETDENGNRTIDSVIAQDIYSALTDEGYRVFFARISLEDKLGTAYEPYIFAALNSAKVMLAVGTDYDYYNAVWVKNEWSRFLALIAKGEKKTLIPCYKDIDAYDIPKEFKHLQAQDMGKVGAMQDLLRGIGKILGSKKQNNPSVYVAADSNVSAMIQRGNMALEDNDFQNAVSFFERALDSNPKAAHAYLGKFLAFHRLTSLHDLQDKVCMLDNDKEFKRAEQFADTELAKELKAVMESNELKIQRLRLIDALNKVYAQQYRLERSYTKACGELNKAVAVDDYLTVKGLFESIRNYKDSDKMINKCEEKFEKLNLEESNRIYTEYNSFLTLVESKKRLNRLTSEVDVLRNKVNTYNANVNIQNETKKEQGFLEDRISTLEKELSSLGRFAFAKKNVINTELNELRSKLAENHKNLESITHIIQVTDINELSAEYAEAEKELTQTTDTLKNAETQLWNNNIPDEESTEYGIKQGDILWLSNTNVNNGESIRDSCLRLRKFIEDNHFRSVVIPDNPTLIDAMACQNNKQIVYVVVPEGVIGIESYKFYNCENLIGVVLPKSIKNIGDRAFSGCKKLRYVAIPEGVTNIGESTFMFCEKLKNLTIPGSVTHIGEEAFKYCNGLESIMVDSSNRYYDSRNNCNALIETETNTLIQGCNNTVIPDGVTEISESAFSGCKRLTSVTIPNSVTLIGIRAFGDCESLTSVTIPRNVSLCSWAFVRCNNLSEESRVRIKSINPNALD